MKKVKNRVVLLLAMVVCLMFGGVVVYASAAIWGGEDDIKGIEVVLDKLKIAVQSRDSKLKENAGRIESELSEKEALKQTIKDKERSIAELDAKQRELKVNIDELRAMIENQKRNYDGEINNYQNQVRDREAEKNAVMKELNDLRTQHQALNTELTRLTKASNEKDAKLEKARTDVKNLRQKADSILQEVNANGNVQ